MDLPRSLLAFDGENNIDIEASVAKFRAVVTVEHDKRKNDMEVIAAAVNTYFDANRGAYITIDAIKSFVCNSLHVDHKSFKVISDRTHEYITENLEAGNGITNEGKPALFTLKKGKGGGFARRSDLKAANGPAVAAS